MGDEFTKKSFPEIEWNVQTCTEKSQVCQKHHPSWGWGINLQKKKNNCC